jgi:hypothetical protein
VAVAVSVAILMPPWTSQGVRTSLAGSKNAANLSPVFLIGTGLADRTCCAALASSSEGNCLGSSCRDERVPRHHQFTSPLEQVTTPLGRLVLVFHDVRERSLSCTRVEQ